MASIVVAVILIPYVRRVSEWFVTIVHEVGHGVTALLLGGGINGIKLHQNGGGLTETRLSLGFFFRIINRIVLFAGYSFPIYLGISLFLTAASGNITYGVIVLVTLGLLTLIFIRNLFGIVIVVVYAATLFSLWSLQDVFEPKYVIAFFGLLFCVRGILDLIRAGIYVFNFDIDVETDFDILADSSWFPAKFWYITYLLTQTVIVLIFLFFAKITISLT